MKLKPMEIINIEVEDQLRNNTRILSGRRDSLNFYINMSQFLTASDTSQDYNYTDMLASDILGPGQYHSIFNTGKIVTMLFPFLDDKTENRLIDNHFGGDRFKLPKVSYLVLSSDITTTEYKNSILESFAVFRGSDQKILNMFGGHERTYLEKTKFLKEIKARDLGDDFIEITPETIMDCYKTLNHDLIRDEEYLKVDFEIVARYFYNVETEQMVFITNHASNSGLYLPLLVYLLFMETNPLQTKFIESILDNPNAIVLEDNHWFLDEMRTLFEEMKKPFEQIDQEMEKYELQTLEDEVDMIIDINKDKTLRRHTQIMANLESEINERRREIEVYRERLKRVEIEKFYAKNSINSENNPLLDVSKFMYNHDEVVDFRMGVSDQTIIVAIKTYLDIYEEEYIRTIMNNTGHEMGLMRRHLINQVFVEGNYRIRIAGVFELKYNGEEYAKFLKINQLSSGSDGVPKNLFNYMKINELDYITNPHLELHDCSGSNRDKIETALRAGNYIPAIMATIATYRSLNFLDDYVFDNFINRLLSSDVYKRERILEDYDGNSFTVQEVVEKEIEKDDKITETEDTGNDEETNIVEENNNDSPF